MRGFASKRRLSSLVPLQGAPAAVKGCLNSVLSRCPKRSQSCPFHHLLPLHKEEETSVVWARGDFRPKESNIATQIAPFVFFVHRTIQ